MPNSIANLTALYNRLAGDRLMDGINAEAPLIGIAKKRTDFEGEGKYQVIKYGLGGGQSSTFANAQANKSAGALARFFVEAKNHYALASIDNKSLLASRSKKGALVDLMTDALDGAKSQLARSYGIAAYRGGGYRAVISSVSGSGPYTITLQNTTDAALFLVGDKVAANTAPDGSGTARAGTPIVTAVDVTAGTLTVATSPTGFAGNDYIGIDGDFGQGMNGLGVIIPAGSVTSTAFRGVDRTVAPQILAGTRKSWSGPVTEGIAAIAAESAIIGGRTDIAFANPLDWQTAALEIGTKERTTIMATLPNGKAGTAGYDAIAVYGGTGRIDLIADPFCPKGIIRTGRKGTLEIWSIGSMVSAVAEMLGGELIESNADAKEIRMGGYCDMVVTEPWHWGALTLTA